MIWCVILLSTSLESNVPKMCFPEKEQCQAYVQQVVSGPAQCNRRSK